MYRLFAGLDIPEDIGKSLETISRQVSGANWRPIENYHITLAFFGDADLEIAETIDGELGKISASQMQLMLKSAGWFGAKEPRALWAGVEQHDGLNMLAKQSRSILRRLNLQDDKHPFKPHVTLAYCNGTSPLDAMAFCQKNALLSLGPFWVDRFYLYSSWSKSGSPSHYVKEAEYPLGPAEL